MGKNASKSFINQFKNTRRLAYLEQRKLVKGLARPAKKFFPPKPKNDKNSNRGDK
ncbi:MAG: hypothetical protein NTZ12_01425 [Candidatus Aminicenantes bacterium]|nr:hypothetical protein [Candidatus Aminicenantes bacterium]